MASKAIRLSISGHYECPEMDNLIAFDAICHSCEDPKGLFSVVLDSLK